jgi:hypothetical protein
VEKRAEVFEAPEFPYAPYEASRANYLFLNEHELFICGEMIEQFKGVKKAWIWNFETYT